jgi:hypothetical protein
VAAATSEELETAVETLSGKSNLKEGKLSSTAVYLAPPHAQALRAKLAKAVAVPLRDIPHFPQIGQEGLRPSLRKFLTASLYSSRG